MDAVDFFAAHHPAPGEISKELQKIDEVTVVSWERVCVHPAYSPGPVADAESVRRTHTNPVHFDPNKQELKPTAFDDAMSFGLSVDRLVHAEGQAVLVKAQNRIAEWNEARQAGAPERSVCGYSDFSAKDVRAVLTTADGSGDAPVRGLGVYDTGLDGEPEHADICVIAPKSKGGRRARAELYKLGNSSFVQLTE